jgi:lipopolysaccharide transport system ATP-binding protein
MSNIVISVENLSKSYVIGHRSIEGHYMLRDVIAREARNFVRKGADLFRGKQIVQGDEVEEFWALRNVSFQVKEGEIVGIIGRNGAGKSTLLKILSRITEPTQGRVRLCGHVGSLLEVGTGFHSELTGRENIYLNGAILGMAQAEIRRKFDEIVAFAGVEKFLDTPAKRYSSGMYVRLAFAVAAHLEPEILIVDEVLAVGDAEFQTKCLGKMKDVSGRGRTVLFVSHNMSAITSLCTKALWMSDGDQKQFSDTTSVVSSYVASTGASKNGYMTKNYTKASVQLASVISHDDDGTQRNNFHGNEDIYISLNVRVQNQPQKFRMGIRVDSVKYGTIFTSCDADSQPIQIRNIGEYRISCKIPKLLLSPGVYTVTAAADVPLAAILFETNNALTFEISDVGIVGSNISDGARRGVIRPLLTWHDQCINRL